MTTRTERLRNGWKIERLKAELAAKGDDLKPVRSTIKARPAVMRATRGTLIPRIIAAQERGDKAEVRRLSSILDGGESTIRHEHGGSVRLTKGT